MKKKALLALLTVSTAYTSACELTVVNNTPFRATIYNRNSKITTHLLSWQDARIGKPEEPADITLSVFTLFGAREKKYRLKQVACSDFHKIRLNVGDVLDNNLGGIKKLFRVRKLEVPKPKKALAA